MTFAPSFRTVATCALVLALVLLPLYVWHFNQPFVLTVVTRVVILAIAATSLNLILGYGGMVSFGHAVYLGLGGYVVGIMAFHGVYSGWLQWAVAIGASALLALAVGALSLRTRGLYFIMITLAFAQLVYYVAVGLDAYGGDDGLTLYKRSDFGGLIDLRNRYVFYYLCLALALAALYGVWRLVNARFGMVLQGVKSNEARMQALGYPVYRYKLAAFVIAGALCGLAGALEANRAEFVSPSMMHWTRSGDLIVMVVLGGMGTLFGPLFGAVAFLVVEELLSGLTEYWQLIFGPLLILMVIFARGGIDSLLGRKAADHG